MKRLLLTASVLATQHWSASWTSSRSWRSQFATAVLLACTGGLQVEGNPGTLTNRGRVVWAIDSTSVFVDAYFAITDGMNMLVIYDSKQGLKDLITCTADLGGGVTAIARGFLTPR